LGHPSIGGPRRIELLPLGEILDFRPTMDLGGPLNFGGDLGVAQSMEHQVSNSNATNFPLLHCTIGSVEPGALLLDQHPSFCERAVTPATLKLVIT
jgi:hypothetical protein